MRRKQHYVCFRGKWIKEMYGHQSGEFVGKPEKAFFSPVAMNSSQCTELNLMFLMPITSEKKRKLLKKKENWKKGENTREIF